MRLPRGQLVRSHVVSDPGTTLGSVLERERTGYAVLEPQDALLLDVEGRGVLTFERGVPVLAYHTGTDRGGPEALADLAVPGPYRIKVFELSDESLATDVDTTDLEVPPGMPAERVAGNLRLADRTRDRARAIGRDLRTDDGDDTDDADGAADDAVTAFLDDEEKVAAIQERAREEARRRAAEWGLDDELSDGSGAPAPPVEEESSSG